MYRNAKLSHVQEFPHLAGIGRVNHPEPHMGSQALVLYGRQDLMVPRTGGMPVSCPGSVLQGMPFHRKVDVLDDEVLLFFSMQ